MRRHKLNREAVVMKRVYAERGRRGCRPWMETLNAARIEQIEQN